MAPKPLALENELLVAETPTLKVRVVCRGKTPLLLHGTDSALMAMIEGKKPPTFEKMLPELDEQINTIVTQIDGQPESEAKAALRAEMYKLQEQKARALCMGYLYRNDKGQIGLPIKMLMACLREAGRSVEIDKFRSMSNADATLMYTFFSVEQEFIPLDGTREWVVDSRPGERPSKRAKNQKRPVIWRPRFNEWGFTVEIAIDETRINKKKIRELFDIAGSQQGLGAFRPGLFHVARNKAITHNEKLIKAYERDLKNFADDLKNGIAEEDERPKRPRLIHPPGHFGHFLVEEWIELT